MTSGNEERMTKLLNFPFGSYLMLRLEYTLLTEGDELEAKILRLIEKRMEDRRRQIYQDVINAAPPGSIQPGKVLNIPREVWAPISHQLFMYDLYSVVKSENTLKRALKSLTTKKLIFSNQAQQKNRYAPAEYRLNIKLIDAEFEKMAQQGKTGYQYLIPSEIDTLETPAGYQELTPSEYQKLTPSGGQFLIPSASSPRSTRVSRIDPHSRSNYSREITVEESVEEPGNSFLLDEAEQATAVTHSSLGNLSDEEVALILELRQQRTTETASQPLEETAPSKQTEIVTQANEQREEETPEVAPALQRPVSDAQLTDEVIVSLYEYKHGMHYEVEERPFQLQAARALLGLRLALSVDVLEHVYDECCDKWWRDHFGDLHVSHLIEKEKNHGQRRIVRLLKRIQSRSQVVVANNSAGEITTSGATTEPRLVEWKGRMIPKEQAYQEGYNGGFENYKEGEHEGDDLEAMVRKYQAQGLLPALEKAQVGNE
jgi:hypothetical protein